VSLKKINNPLNRIKTLTPRMNFIKKIEVKPRYLKINIIPKKTKSKSAKE
jgi:hypothetical protein